MYERSVPYSSMMSGLSAGLQGVWICRQNLTEGSEKTGAQLAWHV